MRISFKSAITLLLALSIAMGVLLYPARGSCITIILKDTEAKVLYPGVEPNIRLAEPGDYPLGTTGPQGSSQGTSIDAMQSNLPKPDTSGIKTARSRYMHLLFFYLRNSTNGLFNY